LTSCIPEGCEKRRYVSACPFLAFLRDAIFLTNATRGFEDSTPGYGL
jgi:hypothetical protein